MQDHHDTTHDPKHHVTSLATYFTIFFILMFLTVVTVAAALHNFGVLNTPIALIIATVKASLVILYFMHARHSTRLTWAVIVTSFVMMGVMFVLVYSDYLGRQLSHL